VDIGSLIGIGLSFSVVIASAILMGVNGAMFLDMGAIILIVGGTIGATMLSFPLPTFLGACTSGFKRVFISKEADANALIKTLVSFAEKARREGLLALEAEANAIDDPFMRKGIQLVIDGRDTDVIRKIMETEVSFVAERGKKDELLFTTMGGFSPTMGIIGTVLGLISMLSKLGSFSQSGDVAGKLGEATASAFIATFFGVLLANVVWLPFAGRLKQRNEHEMLMREIQIEGVLSVQAGDNPRLLEEKLHAYLDPSHRKEEVAQGGAPAAAPEAVGA
jgi:chemotaxis protein MotA